MENTYFINTHGLVWRKVDGEVIVLDHDAGYYFVLNQVASAVWERLLNNESTSHIISMVSEEYDERADRIESDIKDLLEMLHAEGLLTSGEHAWNKTGFQHLETKKVYQKPSFQKYQKINKIVGVAFSDPEGPDL